MCVISFVKHKRYKINIYKEEEKGVELLLLIASILRNYTSVKKESISTHLPFFLLFLWNFI